MHKRTSNSRVTYRVLEHDCQHATGYFAQEDDDQKRHKLNKHAHASCCTENETKTAFD